MISPSDYAHEMKKRKEPYNSIAKEEVNKDGNSR